MRTWLAKKGVPDFRVCKLSIVNLQIIHPFFGASDTQICKSQNLTFCVPDVPPKFVVLLTSIRINTPTAALPPLPPILPLHPRNVAPNLAQDTILHRLPATILATRYYSTRVSQMSAFASCEFVNLQVFFWHQRFTNSQNLNCEQTCKIRKNLQAVGLVQNLSKASPSGVWILSLP